MQRLVARVAKLSPVEGDESERELTVRVSGGAYEAIKLPDGVKGRELTIQRRLDFPWQVAVGDQVLLTTAEADGVFKPRPEFPELTDECGVQTAGEGDEVRARLANPWLVAGVDPLRGGRVTSLRTRRGGHEVLFQATLPGREKPEAGGLLDILPGSDPGDLPLCAYTLAEVEPAAVTLSRAVKKPVEGALCRTVGLAGDRPWLELTAVIRRQHEEPKKDEPKQPESAKDGKSEEDEANQPPTVAYRWRAIVAFDGRLPDGELEYLLPSTEGLRRQRYWPFMNLPSCRPNALGCAGVRETRSGRAVLCLFEPDRVLETGRANWGYSPAASLRVDYRPAELQPGCQQTCRTAVLVADAVEITEQTLAAVCVSSPADGRQRVYVVVRAPVPPQVEFDGTTLALQDVAGCGWGGLWGAELLTPVVPGKATVTAGDERLVLSW